MSEVKALIKYYEKQGWCWLSAVAFLADLKSNEERCR